MKIKHQSSSSSFDEHMDKLTFPLPPPSHPAHTQRFISLASQNSIWNTKQNFRTFFFFEAFSLAEIQYKNLQCCEFMSYYQPCTMGTFLLCSIYMFILHVGQAVVSKPASSNYFIVGLCDETPYSTFKLNLVQHWGEHSMSIELLQAAWLPSNTKSAGISALESLREFSFLSFSPPHPLFFSLSLFFKIPPAPRGLISTSLWFSRKVFHLQQRTHRSQRLANS